MRHARPRLAVLTALALTSALTACASNAAVGGAGRSRDAPIPAEELEKWSEQDLFTVIQRLRPAWFQSRAAYTGIGRQEISVILDGVIQHEGYDLLRNLRAGDTREVRYMGAGDATTLYGTGMSAGAILVFTKR
ncbi:MAG TPA: hypothetical protein VLH75_00520 [Longimicrobiales bacterium]|nr:hypothetical protein [Longimicrobiales bacterium]